MQPPTQTITRDMLADTSAKATKSRSRRSTFLKWLRNVHGWIGLWGAVIGLLFGITGILQNHRATMKIKVGEPVVSTIHIALPTPAPQSPRELAQYLQTQLKLDRPAQRVSREPAKPVSWGDRSVIQPEHWTVRFMAPDYSVSAEMWKGDTSVSVERRDQGLLNTLQSLHKSDGAGVGWILFADSLGGSLILLSITGVLLWTELHRRKTIGASIFIASLITAIVLAANTL